MSDQPKPAGPGECICSPGENMDGEEVHTYYCPQSDKPTTGSQNPGREEIYDEMTSRIKGDKPATIEWTVDEHGKLRSPTGERFDNVHHPEHLKDAINAALTGRRFAVASEWTVERIHSYKCDGDLIEDINAALAAEKEKLQELNNDYSRAVRIRIEELQQLREQLAAEQDKTRMAEVQLIEAKGDLKSAEKQLAAEREKWEQAVEAEREAYGAYQECDRQRQQLREQLAAERATVKEYEDYIKSLDRIAGLEAQ